MVSTSLTLAQPGKSVSNLFDVTLMPASARLQSHLGFLFLVVLAARIITAIDNPNDVCVISARPYGHRAVLKFASSTGAQAIAGRFTRE